MPEAADATTWSEALDAFAAVLERNERRLVADSWHEAEPVGPVVSRVPEGEPGDADRARAALLLQRAADQERRLRAERDATAAALGELGRRRVAARLYTE